MPGICFWCMLDNMGLYADEVYSYDLLYTVGCHLDTWNPATCKAKAFIVVQSDFIRLSMGASDPQMTSLMERKTCR